MNPVKLNIFKLVDTKKIKVQKKLNHKIDNPINVKDYVKSPISFYRFQSQTKESPIVSIKEKKIFPNSQTCNNWFKKL